jgi:hypothetical protein
MKQKQSAILSKTTSIRRRAPCHGKIQQLITMDSIHVIINLIIIFSPVKLDQATYVYATMFKQMEPPTTGYHLGNW